MHMQDNTRIHGWPAKPNTPNRSDRRNSRFTLPPALHSKCGGPPNGPSNTGNPSGGGRGNNPPGR